MAQERDGLLPPRYQQVASDLRKEIERGSYPAGTRLPTKTVLMERFGVALGTLDKAIDLLRQAGLVETRQGSGMYIREPPPERAGLAEEIAQLRAEVRELAARADAADERIEQIDSDVEDAFDKLGYTRTGGNGERGDEPPAARRERTG